MIATLHFAVDVEIAAGESADALDVESVSEALRRELLRQSPVRDVDVVHELQSGSASDADD